MGTQLLDTGAAARPLAKSDAHDRYLSTVLPIGEMRRWVLLRWALVIGQIATLCVTWPLWQARDFPPHLPALPLPQFDLGGAMVASLFLVLVAPWWGMLLHSALLVLGMLMDQTRMQPEFMSLGLLLWATLRSENLRLICRAHLLAMWFYAGLHKLFSPMYWSEVGRHIFHNLYYFTWIPDRVADALGVTIAVVEMLLAVLALFPRTRRAAVVIAVGMHLSIFVALTHLLNFDQWRSSSAAWTTGHWQSLGYWREAVWPWNLALMVAAFVLIGTWKSGLRETWSRAARWSRWLAVLFLVSPLAYYGGFLDAYLAHCLYSDNVPRAAVRDAHGELHAIDADIVKAMSVPIPPAQRLFEAYFKATAGPDDALEIDDSRWIAWMEHRELQIITSTSVSEGRRVGPHTDLWCTYHYPNGQKSHEGRKLDGRDEGRWTFWSENGHKEAEGEFRDDRMDGAWTFWDADGEPRTAYYKDGELAPKPD